VIEIVHFQTDQGKFPFREWMSSLRDKVAKTAVSRRLHHLEFGNLGDAKSVGEGVTELRIHVGAGYRVYLGQYGEHWIVLLCGGDKNSQAKDIARAKAYWAEWKGRQQ
jgi:putative addiction module killer protein